MTHEPREEGREGERPVEPVEPLDDTVEPTDATLALSTERLVYQPAIDIFDTEEGLVLRADLPGVSPETLELQVQDNKLTLFGRVEGHAPEGARIVHREYGVGDFLRSFILGDDVDHERITAKLNHGVLRVTLPRAEREEPRRIRIESD